MRQKKGSGLVDYILPTALVGIVFGTSVYYLVSENKISNFLAASANMNLDLTTGTASIKGPLKVTSTGASATSVAPSSLGGTIDAPQSKCKDGVCDIDYGEFVLPNISENFAADMELHGSAIGTSQIASILEAIANQLDDPTTPADEGAEFRDMANTVHFLAANQKKAEDFTDAIMNDTTLTDAEKNDELEKLLAGTITPLIGPSTPVTEALERPSNIDHILTNYDKASIFIDTALTGTFNDVRNTKLGMPSFYNDMVKSKPLYAIYDQFDNIMNNPKYSDGLKNVTQELFLDIDDISFNFNVKLNHELINKVDNYTVNHMDPITGAVKSSYVYNIPPADKQGEIFNKILKPDASLFTDLDAALICTAGKSLDDSKACH